MVSIDKLLIVEGIDDKYVISRLLQRRKINYKASDFINWLQALFK